MNKKLFIPIVFILMGFHIFLARGPIREYGPTYDEPLHLTAGYVYLKTGNYHLNGYHHPAFGEMWPALPLLGMEVSIPKNHKGWIRKLWGAWDQFRFADTFLYQNNVSAERLLEAGRWMQVALSLILGALVAVFAWRVGGSWASLFALIFWAFSPSILANATVVTTDLAFTTFNFLFFASFLLSPSKRSAYVSGTALGLALASKYFAIACIPLLIGVAGVQLLLDRKVFIEEMKMRVRPSYIAIFLLGCFLVLLITYQGFNFSYFYAGIKNIFGRSQMGRESFFMGEHRSDGWLAYFPVAFLLKTPVPLLLALVWAVVLSLAKKIRIPKLLWLPPILFLALACTSKVQIGQRYILMIYPFLFVAAAVALARNRNSRIAGAVLTVWLMGSMFYVRPHFLPYFNELIGGPSQGYRYFTDSNNDWGQSIKSVAAALEPADLENGIYLSYFGVGNPRYYGLKYYDVGSDTMTGHPDDSNLTNLKPTKFAISITNLQSTYYSQKDVFSWLKDFEPWKRVGHSIFIYDFKDNPDAITRLEQMRTGRG